MVVEDEPGIYELLLAMFEIWGIEGRAFVDGDDAIAWIEDTDAGKSVGETPELALVDIRLQQPYDGVRVAERLRRSPTLQNIGIVLITAYHLSSDAEREVMDRSGADKLLYKPLPRFHELKRVLEEVIAQRRVQVVKQPAVPNVPPVPVKAAIPSVPAAPAPKLPPSPQPPPAPPADSLPEQPAPRDVQRPPVEPSLPETQPILPDTAPVTPKTSDE
jgi:CheY-like chemotaxis protein